MGLCRGHSNTKCASFSNALWEQNCHVDDKWAIPKKMGFWSKYRWSTSPSKFEGPHEVILGVFPFFMEQATFALLFIQMHLLKLCTTVTLSKRGKTPPKLGIICERYRLLNLAPTFGQHMERPSKTSNANPNKKNPTCLEHEVFICDFGPHGSGHHPTPVHTFHPRRLPPCGLQGPSKY